MKTNKIIFTITVVIALFLATLCGCKQTNNTQADNEDTVGDLCLDPAPLAININDDTNFKEEVFKHIQNSKTPNHEEYETYNGYKLPEIKEFYNFDVFMIDGYKLFRVDVGDAGFVYYFCPIEGLEKDDWYRFMRDSGIEIRIRRTDYMVEYFDASDPFRGIIEQAEEQGWEYLVKDGMFYSKTYEEASIKALIGDTIFKIDVRGELNSYEYLSDLAFKVIETAELVVVGE